jgi:hypothetical protein
MSVEFPYFKCMVRALLRESLDVLYSLFEAYSIAIISLDTISLLTLSSDMKSD